MSILDILLLAAGCSAGVFSFLSGNDSLHKLFLGLVIGFLTYALISTQVDLAEALSIAERNSYQNFLLENTTGILTFTLLLVPFLGLVTMLSPKLKIITSPKSFSHILLWLMLPLFLVGILSFLWDGSLLSDNPTWSRIFSFFEASAIYGVFKTLPWALFALLWFLIFYKTIFSICINFCIWFYHDVIKVFFKSWKESRKKKTAWAYHTVSSDIDDIE